MGKGIMGFFRGKEKNKQKFIVYKNDTEENDIEENDTKINSGYKSKEVVCFGCGAKNLIVNDTECEYCGSLLAYIAAPLLAATKTQNTKIQNSELPDDADTYTLSTGFYTAGIDIPVGTCNVTAISGSGNLLSSDYELDENFGLEEDDVSSFKGLKLPKGVSLNVLGLLSISIAYKVIEDGFSGRTYDISAAIDLSTGNYESGTDFESGIYNIVAVSGSGTLTSDDAEVDEMFGLDDGDVNEIKNVYLPEGVELSLEGNISVKLIPAV